MKGSFWMSKKISNGLLLHARESVRTDYQILIRQYSHFPMPVSLLLAAILLRFGESQPPPLYSIGNIGGIFIPRPHIAARDREKVGEGRDQMGSVGRSGRFTAIAFPFHANRPTTFWLAPISHILHQLYFPTVPAPFRDRGAVLPRRRHLVRLPYR